jgi:hypothetical protein
LSEVKSGLELNIGELKIKITEKLDSVEGDLTKKIETTELSLLE